MVGRDADAFPCGAALQAVRSPRASAAPPLIHCGSAALSSSGSLSSGPTVDDDDASVRDNNDDAGCAQLSRQQPSTPSKAATDLARRSQQRVTDRKRSELERREEEEQRRRARSERDRQARDQAARLKMRRRAEIYALNAILRELQQRKIAEYIEAQRAEEQQQGDGGSGQSAGTSEVSLCASVQAIGV